MSKTLNSTPTSEWQAKDTCPNCGSPCDIYQDLDEKDFCNDCRPAEKPLVIRLKSKEDFKKCAKEYKDTSTLGWKMYMWDWFEKKTCYVPSEDCLISLDKAVELKFIDPEQ